MASRETRMEKGEKVMPDRIDSMDERLRDVEAAVLELVTMSRMLRAICLLLGTSLGLDVTGVI